MSCRVTKVLAPNGEPSILYRDLSLITSNASETMQLYLQAKALGIGEMHVDVNGEPLIDEIVERLQDITPITQKEFEEVRPDFAIEAGALTPEIESLAKHLEKTIREVKRKIDAGPDNQDLRHFFEGAHEKLQADMLLLLTNQSAQSILDIANRELAFAKKIGGKTRIADAELKHVIDITDMWKFDVLREFLTPEQRDSENIMNTTFQEIAGVAESVYNEILEVARQNTKKRIEARNIELGRPDVPINIRVIKDISFQEATFLDLTHAAPKIASELASSLARAQRNQAGDLGKITKTLDKLSQGVDVNRLLQKDENGKDAYSLINEYSNKYFKEVNRLSRRIESTRSKANFLPQKERTRAMQKAYSRYYRGRNEVEHVIDLRYFVPGIKPPKTRKYNSKSTYRAFLVDQYGEEKTAALIDDAISKWSVYQNLRADAKERFAAEALSELEDITKENIDEYVNSNLSKWDAANNPLKYIEESANIPGTQFKNVDGWRHSVRVPIAKNSVGQSTKLFDESFNALMQDEKAKALYDYVVDTMDEMKSYLPTDVSNRLEKNFLATIQRSLVEKYVAHDWAAVHNHMAIAGFDAITGDNIIELGDTVTKEQRDTAVHAPIRFVNDESVPKSNRSTDIIRLIEMFSAMALHYKTMTEVEDMVLISQRIVAEAEKAETSGMAAVIDRVGNLLTEEGGVVNLNKSIAYTIRASILGKKRAENEWESRTTVFGGEEGKLSVKQQLDGRKKARTIRHKKNLVERKLEDEEITQEKYDTEIKILEEQYEKLGGKNLVWSGVLGGVLSYAQIKGMGWNVTAGMTNMAWGLLSNVIHGAAEVDFNNKQIRKAIRMMLKDRTARNSKTARLVQKLGILFEITEAGYGKTQERRQHKFLSHLRPYEIQRRTEFVIQGASMVAQMMNTPIEKLDGTMGDLFDAYDGDGEWKTDEYGETGEWQDEKLGGRARNKFTDFRDKVIQVNKSLHGNYDPNSPTLIKSYTLGRALMMFRSWMPEGFAYRFQEKRWDDQLGRDVKGRYITYKDIIQDHGFMALPKSMLMSLFGRREVEFTETGKISELDMQNLRSNIMELKILVGIALAGVLTRMAMAELDDDDELAFWTGRILLTQFARVEQDLTYYVSPKGIFQVNKNVLPLMSTITGTAKLLSDAKDFMADPNMRGYDQYEKIARNLIPFGQMARIYDPSERVVFD